MADEERESQKSFKVQDRRRFSASGEAREEVAAAADAPPEAASEGPPPPPPAAAMPGEPSSLTFTTFTMSLITQALALLGEIPDPLERAVRVDLDAARQLIDILGILSEKTRGNLDAGEAALLDGALYDLRMKYVERAQSR